MAQRSADAAREIKSLISASKTQVDTGVKLVGQTGQALSRIMERVTEVAGVVAAIAVSTGEQAASLAGVNTAVNHMDQFTQQNAALMEQSNAASQALAEAAVALSRQIGRFEIGTAEPAGGRAAPRAA